MTPPHRRPLGAHTGRLLLLTALLCVGGCPPTQGPALPPVVSNAGKEDIAPEQATGFRDLEAVVGARHMTAAANPHAFDAGRDILRKGGSAADAAIAMAMVLTLVEPQSSGIGGGAFLLHFDSKRSAVQAYDGRETAPAAATEDMFLAGGKPLAFFDAVVGGLSVGVPGELRMLEMVHRAHGRLPWKDLFVPAITLAEDGFAISPRLHALLAADDHLRASPTASAYFYHADGTARAVGELLVNRPLAAVLRAVAEQGADALHEGPLARDIVLAVRGAARPGRLTESDLDEYEPREREPLCFPYRQVRLCGMPPPTSGGVAVGQILGMLEARDLAALAPVGTPAAIPLLGVHLFAEASRLAYADRDRYLADPDFVDVPVAALLDPAYLKRRGATIADDRAMGHAEAGSFGGRQARRGDDASLELPSTSHLVAVDNEGNAVSMTASIENAFGSRLLVHGFLLNNELTDFSFVPERDGAPVANRVQPGKRPRSSMAPFLVLGPDGRFFAAVGSPGGSRIIGYVARTLIAMLDWGLDPQQAVALPHVQNRNGATELESVAGQEAWTKRTEQGLVALGHEVVVQDLNSGLQAVVRRGAGYVGGADPRREGSIAAD